MSYNCVNPLVAVSLGKDCGKHHLKFLPRTHLDYNLFDLKRKYGDGNVFLLPCGKCEACRRNYAETWAIRCTLEAMCHDYNYFVTLTYDDAHLPFGDKRDIDLFLDRLEGKGHKNKVKYFICKEFGEMTGRLHYHAILFMDDPLVLKDACKLNGNMYYHSEEIEKAWIYGLHNVATFECNCARYVAKYATKDGKAWMSRNLGKQYVKEHLKDIIDDEFKIYGQFGSKNYVNLPTPLMRWIIEDESNLVMLQKACWTKEERQELGKMVLAHKIRDIGSVHQEHLISTERSVISKKRSVRKL